MFSQRAILLFLCSASMVNALLVFELDCTNIQTPCTNDCYAVYVGHRTQRLTWPGEGRSLSDVHRSAAGCKQGVCCGANPKMDPPDQTQVSCDEYPFASMTQGGQGASLRCVNLAENTEEGRRLGLLLTNAGGCHHQECTFQFGIDMDTVQGL